MTPDAAFGYQRAGTPEALAALGRERGFEVVVVPPFEIDGRAVRSSEVRAAIAAGDLGGAARLLGRPHAVVGRAAAAGRGASSRSRSRSRCPPTAVPVASSGSAGVPGDAAGHEAVVAASRARTPSRTCSSRARQGRLPRRRLTRRRPEPDPGGRSGEGYVISSHKLEEA